VKTTLLSLAINDETHDFFLKDAGLRQGNLISPSLFVLCLEYFSQSVKVITYGTKFNYHLKCASLAITHLIFVNNLVLFSKKDVYSI
jgi:hypothetical protein